MIKRKKIDVLILIEHRAREFESAVLLKYFLNKKGYDVIIESIKFHKESIVFKYKPEIVVVPWAYSNKEIDLFRNFKFLRKNDEILIVNMHHEQISNDGSDSFIIPKEDAKKVVHVSWGDNYSTKLLNAGSPKNSIIQSGNPRLDFYKGKLKNLSTSKKALSKHYNLDMSKKWILFIANSFHLLNENQIQINLNKGVDIREQIEASIKNRNDYLDYVKKYLEKHDDVLFIYRPHPSFAHLDRMAPEIIELSRNFKNFKCISENPIRDWIINSDITISFHSTSVIECAVSNTPFYLFRSHELSSEKDYNFFKNYDYVIKDYNDFYSAIRDPNKFSFTQFSESIKEYIDLKGDMFSSCIIADNIDEMYKRKNISFQDIKFQIGPFIRALSYMSIKKILYSVSKINFIKGKMIKTNDIRFFNLFYSGDDYFELTEIDELGKKIKELLGDECQ